METSKKVVITLSSAAALIALGVLGAFVINKINKEDWDF